MRPYQILTFFISVILVLLIISVIFPARGLKINDELKLTFFSIDELFSEDSIEYADISGIIEHSWVYDEEILEDVIEKPPMAEVDSIAPIDTIRADGDSLKRIIHPIEFPEGQKDLFNPFFKKASSLSQKKDILRILHYGDSQIETDRITGYIRNRMQRSFGGSGCGLVPAVPLYNGKSSIKQAYSGDWHRFTGFINRDTTIRHKRYGALFGFSAIRNSIKDTLSYEWLQFEPSPISYSTSRYFNNISLILGKSDNYPLNLRLILNDTIYDEIYVNESFRYNRLNWKLEAAPGKVIFEVSKDESLAVYGVSFDNNWGIAMDNIPLRGSSGLIFSKTDTVFLKQMYQDMNVGLIILQFGGNAVPYMKNVSRYERFFLRELKVIKRLVPTIPVLVVGPSDMSIKENGKYITHPNLEKIRDAIKNATLNSGFAFWDMYEAMGGRNSMPAWVFAEPSLAISDFVHFNSRGARVVGEMLYNSIIYEYNIWKENSTKLAEMVNN
ncbi:MAG: hypothetical protein ACP5E3_03345 [Bacteroidales bacterium]